MGELDGLRFVAIAFVYLFHLSGDIARHTPENSPILLSPLYLLLQRLNIGVPLFFAISGMILGLPFARFWLLNGPKVSLSKYFLRRLTRLEPPYIGVLVLFFLLKLAGHRGTISEMLPHLGASALYLHSVLFREMSSINPVAWSLEVEVQFYILAPVLGMLFAIRSSAIRRALLAGVIIVVGAACPWVDMDPAARANTFVWMTHLSLAGNIQYFLIGFLLADLYLTRPPREDRSSWPDIVSVVGWLSLVLLLILNPAAAYKLLPLFIVVLYLPAFYGRFSRGAFSNLYIATIGGMCYSIYLLHNYLIALVGMVTERVGGEYPFEARLLLQTLLMTPVILFLCILYYRMIEQPCMKPDWPSRLRTFLAEKAG